MGNRSHLRRVFLCVVAVLCLHVEGSFAYAARACMETPAAAIKSAGTESLALSMPEGNGYRVTSVRWDPVLRESWATIVRCGHPEWPGFSLRVDEANRAPSKLGGNSGRETSSAVPVVRAGDVVQLWRQEDLLRIEVGGVAEQSGRLGETIRVRLLPRNGNNQSMEEQLSGVVRGRFDVEMQP